MTDENETTTKEVTPRRKWRYDPEARTVTMTEPSGSQSTYPLATLPQASQDHIMQLGLVLFLGRASSPDETYDALTTGGGWTYRGEAKPRVVSHWKQAVANALADFSKKAGTPLSADDASAKVNAMDRKDFNKLKSDASVVKHWRKLSGVEAVSLTTLLAA